MNQPAFEIYVASHDSVCSAVERDLDLPNGELTSDLILFPEPFEASQILQLEEAVASLTGVSGDFGNDENRREPVGSAGSVFVDRLDPEWVRAAAALDRTSVEEVRARWCHACEADEGEPPAWINLTMDSSDLVERFLKLCRLAVEKETDLVMVWAL